jgi:hypothetical protein
MALYDLTGPQLKVLEVMTNPDHYFETQEKKAELAGVSPRYIRKVVRLPKFQEALETLRKDVLASSLAPLIRKALKEAMGDSFQDRQMLLKIGGVLVEKLEHKGALPVKIAYEEDITSDDLV